MLVLLLIVAGSSSAPQCAPSSFRHGTDCYGDDLTSAPSPDAADCCAKCSADAACKHWTHDMYSGSGAKVPTCFLKSACTKPQGNANAVSGTAPSPSPAPAPGGGYRRVASMEGSTFFDGFEFFTGSDPTHGFVEFVDETTARAAGMIDDSGGGPVLMAADRNTTAGAGGRRSVRLQSKTKFTTGLFVVDLAHVPTGCGTWPAFWTCGPSWPTGGEIDIFEVVHESTTDMTTLHTDAGCSQSAVDPSLFTGKRITSNCDVNAAGQGRNQGCGIQNPGQPSAGSKMNGVGGGTIATLWDATGIKSWFFPRGSVVPADIAARTISRPGEAAWGKPYAAFGFGKDTCPATHFHDHQIIFDLTFCGDWAGAVFAGECAAKAGTGDCSAFVKNNPAAMQEAYWRVGYVDVYQDSAGISSSSSADFTFHGTKERLVR